MGVIEQRKEPRLGVRLQVSYLVNGQEHFEWAHDISKIGIFISSESPEPIWTRFKIEISIPPAFGTVRGHASVVRVADEASGNQGMGAIVHFTGKSRAAYFAYIDSLLLKGKKKK